MKKIIALLITLCLMFSAFAGCSKVKIDGGGDKPSDDAVIGGKELVTDKDSIDFAFNKLYTGKELTDDANNFVSSADVKGARFLVNGEYHSKYTALNSREDLKLEFYNHDYARMVNVSAGMAYTVPTTKALEVDYSIAKYRTQIVLGDSILSVSAESSNPYTQNTDPWATYRDEWILRWIASDDYIAKNDLKRTSKVVFEDKAMRKGYDIYMYSIQINDESGNIDRPFYNIGIIRNENDNINFGFFVMKSKQDRTQDMQDILMSYTPIVSKGIVKNYYKAGAPEANPNWNEETKQYYEQLQQTKEVGWGAFSYSMPGTSDSLTAGSGDYDTFYNKSVVMQDAMEAAWGHEYDIFPTYTHLGIGTQQPHYFPNEMADALAGGNGKNGKPVLQFTYQFTVDNNNVLNNSTPLFDILRGKYDEHLIRLARDIKAYGKPVLFRLNNEMNTDWTSYCGMLTLCDPDIFSMTWKYLYEIFEQEKVDNSIWIWNPIAGSCPFSSWGEDLCYNPGAEYVQLLGLTDYQWNNGNVGDKVPSFNEMYSALYKKNAAWSQYRAIISEFACGSGATLTGVKGRNAAKQAAWVKGMFEDLNAAEPDDFVKQIAGAIWFNCNDGAGVTLKNRLIILDPMTSEYDDLKPTIAEFKKGFATRL